MYSIRNMSHNASLKASFVQPPKYMCSDGAHIYNLHVRRQCWWYMYVALYRNHKELIGLGMRLAVGHFFLSLDKKNDYTRFAESGILKFCSCRNWVDIYCSI